MTKKIDISIWEKFEALVMSTINANGFEMSVWTSGYPIWCILRYEGREMQIHHNELSSLKFLVEQAMQLARCNLPDRYKEEV